MGGEELRSQERSNCSAELLWCRRECGRTAGTRTSGRKRAGPAATMCSNSGRGGALVYGGRREEERHSACL